MLDAWAYGTNLVWGGTVLVCPTALTTACVKYIHYIVHVRLLYRLLYEGRGGIIFIARRTISC